jgi:hypothetical protein
MVPVLFSTLERLVLADRSGLVLGPRDFTCDGHLRVLALMRLGLVAVSFTQYPETRSYYLTTIGHATYLYYRRMLDSYDQPPPSVPDFDWPTH